MSKRELGFVFKIQDELLSKIGTCVSWKGNSSLVAFASKRPQAQGVKSSTQQYSPKLYEVEWNKALHNPITRKLVNESHGIFVSFQKKTNDESSNIKKVEEIILTSHKYRSVLSATIFNLQEALNSTTDESTKGDFLAQDELFYMIELLWHLCEILFIDAPQGGLVMSQLLDWIQWHSNEGEVKANEALEFETPYNQPCYWEAIYCYLLQGKLEEAIKLLKIHNCSDRDDFISMTELLRKMPVHQPGSPAAEFNLQWRYWQDECMRRLRDGEFSSLANLEKMSQILCGEKHIFVELSYLCGTWYHLMISQLLYTNPSVKAHSLSKLAKECMEVFGGLSSMQDVDLVLLSAFDLDLSKLLQELCLFPDGWWFLAHLVDLLYHSGHFETGLICHFKQLREFAISNFALSLMDHHSMWQIGVDYLDCCAQYGRGLLETYLERIPIKTDKQAWKLLAIAEKREMNSLVNSICKIMAVQSLQNGQTGSALMWAVRTEDTKTASYIADKFLTEYNENGSFSDLNLLDNLGSSMLVSDRLTFLCKYREFHRLYEDKEFRSAADLLISLLASNLAPRNFWLTLLLDAIPLLESEELIFSSQQTFHLLFCLKKLLGNDAYLKEPLAKEDEKVSLLRLSISRNLARAQKEEGSSMFV